MPYLFTCPHCQTKTQVDDQFSGQSGECVTCGGAIEVPPFAEAAGSTAQTARINERSIAWALAGIVLAIGLGSVVFAVFQLGGVTMTQLNTNRQRMSSMQNLSKIAAALNAYAADHGKYPPPIVTDAFGKPLYSWRVVILPYLDQQPLYDMFRLDQPFDDLDNQRVAQDMPLVFQHPTSNNGFLESPYYLIVGAGTLFPPLGPLGPDQIDDGSEQTILVIEGAPISMTRTWTEPIDLDFGRMQGKINGPSDQDPGHVLEGGAAMATADGRGHFLPDSTPVATVRALVTPNGGERLPDDTLD